MKREETYKLLVAKMQEIAVVPPQKVGPFTFAYKRVVPYFKYAPWRSALFLSFFISASLYILFGSTLVKLVSLLQFGF